jgi:hypothetical protein
MAVCREEPSLPFAKANHQRIRCDEKRGDRRRWWRRSDKRKVNLMALKFRHQLGKVLGGQFDDEIPVKTQLD